MGKQLALITADSNANPEKVADNVKKMADQGVKLLIGGTTSEVSRSTGREAKRHNIPYIATLAYANEITGIRAHRYLFRENPSAEMSARALASYFGDQLSGSTFFYITASASWGESMESSMRIATGTTDTTRHGGILTQYPKPRKPDLTMALAAADNAGANVLVLIQFGQDLATVLREARHLGMQDRYKIIVPVIDMESAHMIGADALAGIISTSPWTWNVPFEHNMPNGQKFVVAYEKAYHRYPSSTAASAYTAIHEYANTVARTGNTDTDVVIKELEGHEFQHLKGKQYWRAFDHQNIQSLYIIQGRDRTDVLSDKYRSDFFKILTEVPATGLAPDYNDWSAQRVDNGKPSTLE
jgi:ABC-type branched-subunit amino acid transport system substrate-binding protein